MAAQLRSAGRPATPPPGAFTPVADGRAYLGRDEHGLYAVVATCTHLGCLVEHAGGGFECPCHGSRFDEAGGVTRVRLLDRCSEPR